MNEEMFDEIEMLTIYDYYDQPLSFTFKCEDKVYYSRLVDYEEMTETDVYWVNEISLERVTECENGKLRLYDLMCGVGKGGQIDERIYIISSSSLNESIETLEYEQAMYKYGHLLPEREEYLEKENAIFIKEGEA